MNLLEQVAENIRSRRLLRSGSRILLAVSGGLDSMVLLHVFHRLAPPNRWDLQVAHYNHGLRGRKSQADAAFVRKSAQALGLPCVVDRGDVRSLAAEQGLSMEMAARQCRHHFLASTARRLKIRTVALAHHADDQVELFFLRLFRGAGSDGLSGMDWKASSPFPSLAAPDRPRARPAVQLIRPFLDVPRSDLVSYARAHKVRHREDATNASLDIPRNRIRHELLPMLQEQYQAALPRVVIRLMEMLKAESQFVQEQAAVWMAGQSGTRAKGVQAFTGISLAVQRQVLCRELQRLAIPESFELVETLRKASGKKVTVGPGCQVWHDGQGHLEGESRPIREFLAEAMPVSLNSPQGECLGLNHTFCWHYKTARWNGAIRKRCERFDADKLGTEIILRYWKPGDRYCPMGRKTPVKLQDLFTNLKVPRAQRHRRVVGVTAGGDIWWVEGLRIAEAYKITPETRRQLVWQWNECSKAAAGLP